MGFEDADEDGSGTINFDEFIKHLDTSEMKHFLEQIGVRTDQARALFYLLDPESDGDVPIEEIVSNCVRLAGGAKAVDLSVLLREHEIFKEDMLQQMTDLNTSLYLITHPRVRQVE